MHRVYTPLGFYAAIAALLLALGAGCEPEPQDDPVKMQVAWANQAVVADLGSIVVTVSGVGFAPLSFELSPEGARAPISLTGIPTGPNRSFRMDCYDLRKNLTWSGTTVADIVAGRDEPLVILLQPVASASGFASTAPSIDSFTLTQDTVSVSGTVDLAVAAHGSGEAPVTLFWAASCGTFTTDPRQASVTWAAPATPITCSLSITVSDGQGTSVTADVPISVGP